MRSPVTLVALLVAWSASAAPAQALDECDPGTTDAAGNPTPTAIACALGAQTGPGSFGRVEYGDIPVYRPATPLPGTHTVGIEGLPGPREGESFEHWEWRMLRTSFSGERLHVRRALELAHPRLAERLLRLERALERERLPFSRRETWRTPQRQAFLFQQGRGRPGTMATTTLTSWHTFVDSRGQPAALAADYSVPAAHLERFHEIAAGLGLWAFGADSNDPGHVFFPEPALAELPEAPLIRLLPRVPVVTIATGRPRDEHWDRAALAEWRRRSIDFAAGPFPATRLPRERPLLESLPDSGGGR